ncbi:MAG: hypothetical protein ACJAVT_002292 [Yoonia sp.]|jgi:hypothetical protein
MARQSEQNALIFLLAVPPFEIVPKMLWLETKWASLVSYGATVDLLKDVLPIGGRLNAETVRRHLGRVATRMEAELADERYSFVETNAYEREQLSNPEGPIMIGIDAGYVRSREKGQSHFEVTVGKSIPTDRPDRYLGPVQSHDEKPKRRLHEILKDQGWQENQQVTFMTLMLSVPPPAPQTTAVVMSRKGYSGAVTAVPIPVTNVATAAIRPEVAFMLLLA